jgi:hypothetical protein
MQLGIIIHAEVHLLRIAQYCAHSAAVFLPVFVFQGGDVKESMQSRGVELGNVIRIQSAPTIPNLL